MVSQRHAGQGMVEFVIMLSILTLIGIAIMTQMTNQGQNATNALGAGEKAAVTAIQNGCAGSA